MNKDDKVTLLKKRRVKVLERRLELLALRKEKSNGINKETLDCHPSNEEQCINIERTNVLHRESIRHTVASSVDMVLPSTSITSPDVGRFIGENSALEIASTISVSSIEERSESTLLNDCTDVNDVILASQSSQPLFTGYIPQQELSLTPTYLSKVVVKEESQEASQCHVPSPSPSPHLCLPHRSTISTVGGCSLIDPLNKGDDTPIVSASSKYSAITCVDAQHPLGLHSCLTVTNSSSAAVIAVVFADCDDALALCTTDSVAVWRWTEVDDKNTGAYTVQWIVSCVWNAPRNECLADILFTNLSTSNYGDEDACRLVVAGQLGVRIVGTTESNTLCLKLPSPPGIQQNYHHSMLQLSASALVVVSSGSTVLSTKKRKRMSRTVCPSMMIHCFDKSWSHIIRNTEGKQNDSSDKCFHQTVDVTSELPIPLVDGTPCVPTSLKLVTLAPQLLLGAAMDRVIIWDHTMCSLLATTSVYDECSLSLLGRTDGAKMLMRLGIASLAGAFVSEGVPPLDNPCRCSRFPCTNSRLGSSPCYRATPVPKSPTSSMPLSSDVERRSEIVSMAKDNVVQMNQGFELYVVIGMHKRTSNRNVMSDSSNRCRRSARTRGTTDVGDNNVPGDDDANRVLLLTLKRQPPNDCKGGEMWSCESELYHGFRHTEPVTGSTSTCGMRPICIASSATRRLVAAGFESGTVVMWDILSGARVALLHTDNSLISVAFHQCRPLFVAASVSCIHIYSPTAICSQQDATTKASSNETINATPARCSTLDAITISSVLTTPALTDISSSCNNIPKSVIVKSNKKARRTR